MPLDGGRTEPRARQSLAAPCQFPSMTIPDWLNAGFSIRDGFRAISRQTMAEG